MRVLFVRRTRRGDAAGPLSAASTGVCSFCASGPDRNFRTGDDPDSVAKPCKDEDRSRFDDRSRVPTLRPAEDGVV